MTDSFSRTEYPCVERPIFIVFFVRRKRSRKRKNQRRTVGKMPTLLHVEKIVVFSLVSLCLSVLLKSFFEVFSTFLRLVFKIKARPCM